MKLDESAQKDNCYENFPIRFTENWFKSFLYALCDIDLTYDARTY